MKRGSFKSDYSTSSDPTSHTYFNLPIHNIQNDNLLKLRLATKDLFDFCGLEEAEKAMQNFHKQGIGGDRFALQNFELPPELAEDVLLGSTRKSRNR